MAKKIDKKLYKCMNFGTCAKADNGEIIEFDAMEVIGGKPKCPCCGQDTLEEQVSGTGGKWKKIAIACGGVLLAAGIGFGVWKEVGQSGSGKEPIDEPVDTAQVDTVKVDTVKQQKTDSVEVVKTPEKPKKEKKGKKETDSGNTKVITKPKPVKPWASYASFDGTTMTFKKAHVIPGTSRMAQPGDRVTGVWKDGEVNAVRWYHADGSPSETLVHD